MHVQANQNNDQIELVTVQDESLGRIAIESADSGLIAGSFVAGPLLANVEGLFRDYEEAVNLQSLSRIDKLDLEIARLKLSVNFCGGPRVAIEDVQIWSDGAISFRVNGQAASLFETFTAKAAHES